MLARMQCAGSEGKGGAGQRRGGDWRRPCAAAAARALREPAWAVRHALHLPLKDVSRAYVKGVEFQHRPLGLYALCPDHQQATRTPIMRSWATFIGSDCRVATCIQSHCSRFDLGVPKPCLLCGGRGAQHHWRGCFASLPARAASHVCTEGALLPKRHAEPP